MKSYLLTLVLVLVGFSAQAGEVTANEYSLTEAEAEAKVADNDNCEWYDNQTGSGTYYSVVDADGEVIKEDGIVVRVFCKSDSSFGGGDGSWDIYPGI